jgi:hypothetical protein
MGKSLPGNRHKTGFRGPSPEVGRATQFKPGESGNPSGRPKAILSEWLRHELEIVHPETGQEIGRMIAQVLIQRALGGDVKAIQVLAERVEGKILQVDPTDDCQAKQVKVVVEYIGSKPQLRS